MLLSAQSLRVGLATRQRRNRTVLGPDPRRIEHHSTQLLPAETLTSKISSPLVGATVRGAVGCALQVPYAGQPPVPPPAAAAAALQLTPRKGAGIRRQRTLPLRTDDPAAHADLEVGTAHAASSGVLAADQPGTRTSAQASGIGWYLCLRCQIHWQARFPGGLGEWYLAAISSDRRSSERACQRRLQRDRQDLEGMNPEFLQEASVFKTLQRMIFDFIQYCPALPWDEYHGTAATSFLYNIPGYLAPGRSGRENIKWRRPSGSAGRGACAPGGGLVPAHRHG